MKSMEEIAANQQLIKEDITYDTVIKELNEALREAEEAGVPIEEGVLGAITGGIVGVTFGPKIMKAICKILGVDERGQFGSLLTSRMMTTALGITMGWKH